MEEYKLHHPPGWLLTILIVYNFFVICAFTAFALGESDGSDIGLDFLVWLTCILLFGASPLILAYLITNLICYIRYLKRTPEEIEAERIRREKQIEENRWMMEIIEASKKEKKNAGNGGNIACSHVSGGYEEVDDDDEDYDDEEDEDDDDDSDRIGYTGMDWGYDDPEDNDAEEEFNQFVQWEMAREMFGRHHDE